MTIEKMEAAMASQAREEAEMTVRRTPGGARTPKMTTEQESFLTNFYPIEKSKNITIRKKKSRHRGSARLPMDSIGSIENNSPPFDSLDDSVRRCLNFSIPSLDTEPLKFVMDESRENEIDVGINDGLFERTCTAPILSNILSFLNQGELYQSVSLVCTSWADEAAEALSNLMSESVGCCSVKSVTENDKSNNGDEANALNRNLISSSVARSMEKDWLYLFESFPTGEFISDGGFKRVYRVWNRIYNLFEAVSVMDIDAITKAGNQHTVAAELATSVLLSSIARRNIVPNFVLTRGMFTCQHNFCSTGWNNITNANHIALNESPKGKQGMFQYIRMELCDHKDAEGFVRNLPNKMLHTKDCRNLLFQMAFALHVASDKFGLRHYDIKLLNFMLQSVTNSSMQVVNRKRHIVLRYGIGTSVFRLRMPPSTALLAKLADFGTSIIRTKNDGQPITVDQFTTFENTPPDYLILGNEAKQGLGHDCFGLGLCMLHLYTGHEPYEVILENVVCPDKLKAKLRRIWKGKGHSIILCAMESKDPSDTLYDTLYRFLVLFGIPEKKFGDIRGKVWVAIESFLRKSGPEATAFERDRRLFSLTDGSNEFIANARHRLEEIDGAMELLLSLTCFDPYERATPIDVLNSRFMSGLIEKDNDIFDQQDIVRSYMSYSEHTFYGKNS